jgi:hypothetical protein
VQKDLFEFLRGKGVEQCRRQKNTRAEEADDAGAIDLGGGAKLYRPATEMKKTAISRVGGERFCSGCNSS